MGGAALLALLALSAPAPRVEVGLERVEAEGGRPLRGRRVGLLVHAASVTSDGRHAVDVLRGVGVEVVRLFNPEHGLYSRAAAGEKIPSGVDARTGLPVVSLYGPKTRPAPEDLADLDVFVFDLQDAGVRFYTYAAALILALEAAAGSGVDFVVLDRPNPLGGERVAGPLTEPDVPKSLVSQAPGPLVHGLTLGELARYVNAGLPKPARLTVVPLKGWKRGMVWADTGRAWVSPSPNLRSADAAVAYPAVALLEATNVSEGRGTESPFLLLGAPWLRPADLAGPVRVHGFALEPARFTPRSSEAAPKPKHLDLECAGLRVRVTDPRAARPWELGVRLLHALRRQPEFRWTREGALDRLLGTRRVRRAIEGGETPEAILAADRAGVEAFRRERKPALLYGDGD